MLRGGWQAKVKIKKTDQGIQRNPKGDAEAKKHRQRSKKRRKRNKNTRKFAVICEEINQQTQNWGNWDTHA